MTQPLLKYFTPVLEQPLIKAIGPSADGDSTVYYVLSTPLGSAKKLDFHGDYFMEDTHYGDPRIKTLPAFYEHLMNDHNNPYMAEMGVEKMEMGISTLLTDEQKKDAGLSLAERWASFEVKRSLEYHDMFANLVDQKLMGMSTQCFPNGKTRKSDGGLTRWIENERSATPTPAAIATLGKVIEVYTTAKSAVPLLPTLKMVKDGAVVDINFENPAANFEETTPAAPEVVEGDLATQVAGLLGDEESAPPVTPAETAIDAKAFQQMKMELESMKQMMEEVRTSVSLFIDFWGGSPEAARNAIMDMMGQPKAVSKKFEDLEKSILIMAKAMKSLKIEDIKKSGSEREQELLDDKNNGQQPGQLRVVKSGVPESLRREAK